MSVSDHTGSPALASAPLSAIERDRAQAVLLVEDDPMLAHVLERILVGAGYDVTRCASGVEALGVIEVDRAQVDVVISDVRLPGLSGDLLALELRRIRPALPILLMTGFSETITPENADLLGVSAVLQKPMTGRDLVVAVRDALLCSHAPAGIGGDSRPRRLCDKMSR